MFRRPGDTHRSVFLRGDRGAVGILRQRVEEIISTRSNIPGMASKTGVGAATASAGGSGGKELTNPIVLKVRIYE